MKPKRNSSKPANMAGSSRNSPVPPPARNPSSTDDRDQWGPVADWYDQYVGDGGSEFHQEVILPGLLRLLRQSRPKEEGSKTRILDLACGQGIVSRRLAEQNCEVIGVDLAEPLVLAGRERESEKAMGITYLVADATQLPVGSGPLQEASFDAIVIVLAIQNIAPLSPVWQACYKLLKPGGVVLVVMMHPCFRVPQHSDWYWDETAARQSRLTTTYLSSTPVEIKTHPGLAAHGKSTVATTHFHRPLQAYINTMGSAGLLIDHLEEWVSHKKSQPGRKQKELDRSRREIPLFLAIRAQRVSDSGST